MPDAFENLNIIMTMDFFSPGMQTIKPKTIEMNPSSKTMLDAILVFCVITGFIVIALEIFAMIFIVVFW